MRELLMHDATLARKFLESEGRALSNLFADFPRGACGNASDILGTWLTEAHQLVPAYVHGERNGHSHGWLQFDTLVLDITSDQFSDGLGPVYCGEQNGFYASFKNQSTSKPSLSPLLRTTYEAMRVSLRQSTANNSFESDALKTTRASS